MEARPAYSCTVKAVASVPESDRPGRGTRMNWEVASCTTIATATSRCRTRVTRECFILDPPR